MLFFLNQPSIAEYSLILAPHVLYPENVDKIHDYSVGLLVNYSCGQVCFTLCLSGSHVCLGPFLCVVFLAWASSLVPITTMIAGKMVSGEREPQPNLRFRKCGYFATGTLSYVCEPTPSLSPCFSLCVLNCLHELEYDLYPQFSFPTFKFLSN